MEIRNLTIFFYEIADNGKSIGEVRA